MNPVLEYIIFIFDMNWIFLKALLKWFLPKKRKSVSGQICLITGAGRGIGRLLALEFARKGARLVLWDINAKGNEETANMVREIGGVAHTEAVDVSNKENVYEAAGRTQKSVGNVNILVNNAGIVYGRDFFDLSDEEFTKTMNVNLMASVWTCRAFLPWMMENNHGHIVHIASTLGLVASPGVNDYIASKHALVGFHNALTLDLIRRGRNGIKTTLVAPHIVKTDMFKSVEMEKYPPPLDPDYCVSTIVDAVLCNKSHIYMPRFIYLLQNMMTWMPHEATIRAQRHYGTFRIMDDVGRIKKEME